MVICSCANINERTLNEAIDQGFNTLGALAEQLNVGVNCGTCLSAVDNRLCDSSKKVSLQG